MIQSPDEWHALSNLLDDFGLLRVNFSKLSLFFIPCSLDCKTDCLACTSRIFPQSSFVNYVPRLATNLGVFFLIK